jgi:hypothetical protein
MVYRKTLQIYPALFCRDLSIAALNALFADLTVKEFLLKLMVMRKEHGWQDASDLSG